MIRSSAEIMLSSIILQIQIPYATEEYLWSNVVHCWYIIMAQSANENWTENSTEKEIPVVRIERYQSRGIPLWYTIGFRV